jgi:hypothetical protein
MTRSEAVLQKPDEVEREMRSIGFCDDSHNVAKVHDRAVKYAAELGRSPVGAMPFEHWLQAIFIPNPPSLFFQNGHLVP